jgi:hypothetical protein
MIFQEPHSCNTTKLGIVIYNTVHVNRTSSRLIFVDFICVMHSFHNLSSAENPYKVEPAYDSWAPWIAPNSVQDSMVINTEYQKLWQDDGFVPSEENIRPLSDEYLLQLLCESTVRSITIEYLLHKCQLLIHLS